MVRLVLRLIVLAAWCLWCTNLWPQEPIQFGSWKAHPSRILVRWKDLRLAQSYSTLAELEGSGLNVKRILSNEPRVWVLELGRQVELKDSLVSQAQRLERLIVDLEASGLFEVVQPDWFYTLGLTEPSDSAYQDGSLWGLKNFGQQGGVSGADVISDPDGGPENAWDISVGSTNVVVAVLDTGVRYTHKDLASQMWRNAKEIPGNGIDDDGNGFVDDVYGADVTTGSGDPWDYDGHGTHVAGIIGAAANNGYPHVGVAWKVKVMAVKILGAAGGFTSDAIQGIYYAVNNGCKVINISWYGYELDRLLLDAIQFASTNGVLVVCAAGNEGNNNDRTPAYPASFEVGNIISVASINRFDKLSTFSNYGARTVHLAAPGEEIFSCFNGSDTDYYIQSGTSMAAPFVSGTAALIWGAFPKATLQEVRERILRSTVPVQDLQGKVVTGGRLNAYKALKASPDGVLEVTIDPRNKASVLISTNFPIYVRVNDLFDVTNATVTATIVETGDVIKFQNDGKEPDAVAGDNVYSAYIDLTPFVLPPFSGELVLSLQVTAPGKQRYTAEVTYYVVGPPDNDNFSKAAKVPAQGAYGEGIILSSNTFATMEFDEPRHAGVREVGASVWWKWSPAFSGPVIVDLAGSSFDAVLAVYTGTRLSNLQEVVSANDVGGRKQPYVIFECRQGETYWICVSGATQEEQGEIRLRVEPNGAPDTVPPQVLINSPRDGEVYTSKNITVYGSAFDPMPNASGVRQVLVSINGGVPQPAKGISAWTFEASLREGQNVIEALAVDYSGNRTRSGSVRVYYQPVIVANDLFVSCLSPSSEFYLTSTNGVKAGRNTGATKEGGEPDHAGNKGGASVWFSWLAPDDGVLTLDTRGSTFDTLVAVYVGDRVDELTLVASNDDAAPGERFSRVRFGVLAGQVYRIAIDGFGGEQGMYRLAWEFTATPVAKIVLLPSEGGTTEPGPGSYVLPLGDLFTITAKPANGYQFVGWDADVGVLPNNPLNLQVTGSLTLAPKFMFIPAIADFEGGVWPGQAWATGGDAGWYITDYTAAQGSFSLRSGKIADGQSSWLSYTGEFKGGVGSFFYRVSSEPGWDFLEFYIDGQLVARWSGEVNWTEYRFEIGPGIHKLEWVYRKDAFSSIGLDAAFVDAIRLPVAVAPGPDAKPRLALKPMLGGGVLIQVTGAVPGARYVLLGAESLSGPWRKLDEEVANTTEVRFADLEVLEGGVRFYRVLADK